MPLGLSLGQTDVEAIDGLVCFAVNQEAEFFNDPGFRPLITGIGKKNAAKAVRAALDKMRPDLVLTCGFAGGLNPHLTRGEIVYCEDESVGLGHALLESGGVSVTFHCADRVAPTAAAKRALRQSTGADVVEMESAVIRTLCKQFQIPSATIRIVLDTAEEDLPLDFGEFMTPDERIDYSRLIWKLAGSPAHIPRLIRFRKQTREAARKLGTVLNELLAARR